MAIATSTALALGAAGIGAAGSVMASKNAKKAQQSQNAANRAIADEANRMEMERFYASRGASQEDIDSGAISDKRSAILPYYLSGLEQDLSSGIASKYGALQEAYNPNEMAAEMGGYRDRLAGAEQGAIDAISGIYDGSQLSESNQFLENINNSRLQGQDSIDVARQGIADARDGVAEARLAGVDAQAEAAIRTAQQQAAAQARRGYNNPGGVLNNSGLAQAGTLQALMDAYSGMAQNRADANILNAKDQITTASEGLQGARERAKIDELNESAKFAAYENNLAQQKNAGQINTLLNSLAANQTAGVQNYFLPENATSGALNRGGFQLGQARAPEVNVPSYTAPMPSNPMNAINAGINSGLSGYMLAQGLSSPRPQSIGADVTGAGTSYYIPGTDQYTI